MSDRQSNRRKSPRRRVRKTGTLEDLKRIVWQALNDVDLALRRSEDCPEILRSASAIATAGGVYARLLENERQAEMDNVRIIEREEFTRIMNDTMDIVIDAVKDKPELAGIIAEGVRPIWQIPEKEA